MEKQPRNRKAFYEKENDLQHGNKRRERPQHHHKSTPFEKLFQTNPASLATLTPKPKKELPRDNTQAYCELYGQELLQLPEYAECPGDFLSRHSIDASLRARMLDWMVEVTASYKFAHKTYFDGVSLMDRYFQQETDSLPPARLHIVGVQCMLVASKMEEVFPLKLRTVHEKIAHRKLPLQELIQTEERIMHTLDYKLNSWTFFDLAMLKLATLTKDDDRTVLRAIDNTTAHPAEVEEAEQAGKGQLRELGELCSYLSKFVVYDYAFFIENSTLLVAESVAKAVLEVACILPPADFFACSLILVELAKQRIFRNVKQHQTKFAGLNNLLKFTPAEVITQVDRFLD